MRNLNNLKSSVKLLKRMMERSSLMKTTKRSRLLGKPIKRSLTMLVDGIDSFSSISLLLQRLIARQCSPTNLENGHTMSYCNLKTTMSLWWLFSHWLSLLQSLFLPEVCSLPVWLTPLVRKSIEKWSITSWMPQSTCSLMSLQQVSLLTGSQMIWAR